MFGMGARPMKRDTWRQDDFAGESRSGNKIKEAADISNVFIAAILGCLPNKLVW
jgi:hypothetical protein